MLEASPVWEHSSKEWSVSLDDLVMFPPGSLNGVRQGKSGTRLGDLGR